MSALLGIRCPAGTGTPLAILDRQGAETLRRVFVPFHNRLLLSSLIAIAFCLTLSAPNSAAATFVPKRGIGLSDPFGVIIRSPIDGSPLAPYYVPWSTRNRAIIGEISTADFDHIRLAVNPVGLLLADEQTTGQIYRDFASALSDILRANLNVVFDMHVDSPDGPEWNHDALTDSLSGGKFKRYVDVVTSLAHFVSNYDPRRVAIELFNEPPGPCHWTGRPQWLEFQKVLYHAARTAAPRQTLILTGPCWSHIEGLQDLDPTIYDTNTLFTIHFYEPQIFVGQGAPWAPSPLRYFERVPYPPTLDTTDEIMTTMEQQPDFSHLNQTAKTRALTVARQQLSDYFLTPMNRGWIQGQIAPALAWADRYQLPHARLWIGEFGTVRDAYNRKTAALEDRLRWFHDVTSIFDQSGMPWCVWNFAGLMGVIIGDREGPLDPRVMGALGLRDSAR